MRATRKILKDSCWLAAAGILFGLLANHLSPRGLSLTRNYFPRAPLPDPVPATVSPAPQNGGREAAADPSVSSLDKLSVRLAQKGLHLMPHAQVAALSQDPRFAQGLVVFVDARDVQHFRAGHIPGAYQFDHYRLQDYIQDVLPACQIAEQVVVYCNGGECEDSEFAAMDLAQLGVPSQKIGIYGGGFTEWQMKGKPIEIGSRGSGKMAEANAR